MGSFDIVEILEYSSCSNHDRGQGNAWTSPVLSATITCFVISSYSIPLARLRSALYQLSPMNGGVQFSNEFKAMRIEDPEVFISAGNE